MKEVLLNLLAASLASVGEVKLVEALQLLYDKDVSPGKDRYKSAVLGARSFVSGLRPLVEKSKTPIDDAILDSIIEAVNTSVANNGIDLGL